MYISEFKLEKWLNPRDGCEFNLGASCVKAVTVEELFEVIGQDVDDFLQEVRKLSLHYGDFTGLDRLLEAIAVMHKGATADMVLTVHGGTGANNMVFTELLEKGDNVVVTIPNYQQHYSTPESLGIEVRYLELKEEDGYQPNLSTLESLVDKNTKLIVLTNPNNPTGAFAGEDVLKGMAEIAKKVDAYILSDEIYRGLDDEYMTSIVDVYDKGIVTSSTSKAFSMAGTRIGWVIVKDKETYDRLENRRSYETISCGVFDELITAIAFENYDKLMMRNRKIVNENKEILDAWLKTQPKLSCAYESYGTTVFIKYDFDIPDDELCRDIYENAGVLLCYGDCFGIPNTFRLGYGFGKTEMFKEALNKLDKYFKTLK